MSVFEIGFAQDGAAHIDPWQHQKHAWLGLQAIKFVHANLHDLTIMSVGASWGCGKSRYNPVR